jgi:hypothetical protein
MSQPMVISDIGDYADINDLIDLLNKDLSYYASDGKRYYRYQIVVRLNFMNRIKY